MLQTVFNAFGITADISNAVPFGSGLINDTWKINDAGKLFILQRINHQIFKDPDAIAYNINITATYLHKHHPDYLFVMPVKSIYDEDIFLMKRMAISGLVPLLKIHIQLMWCSIRNRLLKRPCSLVNLLTC